MTIRDVKQIIKMDCVRNVHPKNRIPIYLLRYGEYYYEKSNKNLIYKIISIFVRLGVKLFINKMNHIPLEAKIGGGLFIPHYFGIVISGDSIIGNNVTIMHQVTIGADVTRSGKSPQIGNNVFIGPGAKIIGDCSVGNNVIIGANATITKDIPDNSTVVGINRVFQ